LFIVSMCTLGNSREREVEVRVDREREVRRGPYYYYWGTIATEYKWR